MNSALDFSTETMLQPVLTQINRLDISRQTTNLTKSKDSTLGAILVRGSVREIQGGGGGGELFDSRPFHFASRFFLISCKDSIPLLSVFNCTFYFCMKKTPGGGGDSRYEMGGDAHRLA